MTAVRVFDPAMCCSTGICGPSIDPKLARFAADLDWLKGQGVSVERFNLSQQPAAFAEDAAVKTALETNGEGGLPLVKVNGEVKSSGSYPSRDELAAWAGVRTAEKAGGCCGSAKSEAPAPKEQSSDCCGPSMSQASAPGEQSSGCCGPSTRSASSPQKKSGCC